MLTSTHIRLLDLPCALHTRILQFIYTPTIPLLSTSLSESLTLARVVEDSHSKTIPKTLLHIALSCRTLGSAVAELLRNDAVALIAQHTKIRFLPGWVIALSHHIKAISTWDIEIGDVGIADTDVSPNLTEEDLCYDTKRLLSCLRVANIALHVLDIASLPLHRIEGDRQVLVEHLVHILNASKHRLMELSIPVDHIVARALQHVALPLVHMLEIHGPILDDEESIPTGNICTAAQLLCVVDDSLRRVGGALKSLRLAGIEGGSLLMMRDQAKMYQTVETLSVGDSIYSRDTDVYARNVNALVDFIALFSNLRNFSWNGDVTEARLNRIVAACPRLEQITLTPLYNYTHSEGEDSLSDDERDIDSLSGVFMACQGKLVSLKLRGFIPVEDWTALGRYNPHITRVSMEIGIDNVAAMIPFLGTHCRNVTALEFKLDRENQSLGAAGWGLFQRAVESASEELQFIHVLNPSMSTALENDIEPAIDAMVGIFKALGDRARNICLEVPLNTRDYKPLVQALVRIARAAANFAKNLRYLQLDFAVSEGEDYFWWVDEDSERDHWNELLIANYELRRQVPSLEDVYLSGLDITAKKYFHSIS